VETGVCGVQHRCLVSKRHGRGQLYVSGMQVFQLVFTLSTGKQIFLFFFFWWRRKRQWEVKKEEGSPTVISQNGRGEKQHISSTPVYTYNWLSFPLQI